MNFHVSIISSSHQAPVVARAEHIFILLMIILNIAVSCQDFFFLFSWNLTLREACQIQLYIYIYLYIYEMFKKEAGSFFYHVRVIMMPHK